MMTAPRVGFEEALARAVAEPRDAQPGISESLICLLEALGEE
jgi:hypothetical protein